MPGAGGDVKAVAVCGYSGSVPGRDLKTFRTDVYRQPDSKKTVADACRIIKVYLDDFGSQRDQGMGLFIWSRTKGSGKTRIAAGIANELMKSYAVKFAVSLTILQEIKNTWRRDAEYSESRLLDALNTVDVLIIDDFGVESPGGVDQRQDVPDHQRAVHQQESDYLYEQRIIGQPAVR